ncbi:MAG: flagellar protein FliT [Candidatus Gastranaerophilales bacterium]|nr:flagellar protein FliT [Candidatus Gastranaerophilales bacterium]
MLSINDYNHLKLLYDKFFKSNAHIKALIEADDWDSVDIAIQEKESLIRQIIFFEKARLEEVKQNKELMGLRSKLVQLEKENIELVKKIKEEFFTKLSSIKKAKKVLNAYEPTSINTVSTFEINDFE